MMVRIQRVMTLVESRGWQRNLLSDWPEQWKMPKLKRNTVTIVAAPNISSVIAHLWRMLEKETGKWEGGDSNDKGSPDPSNNNECCKVPPEGGSRGIKTTSQPPFLNPDPFQWWCRNENVAKVKINGESCMALLDNGAQVNTIMLRYVSDHSLQVGPITNCMGSEVTCVGLGNDYTRLLGKVVIQVQADGVWGYNEDKIALVIPDLSNFMARILVILGTPTIGWVVNIMKEAEMDALAIL